MSFMVPTYKKGKKKSHRLAIAILLLAILIGAVLAVSSSSSETKYISQTTKIYLNANGIVMYKIPYSASTFALYLKNVTDKFAVIYITKTPVLAYPVVSVYLPINGSANVSSSLSGASDVHLRLISSSSNGANLEITPLEPSLGIKVSGYINILQPSTFYENILYTGSNVSVVYTTSTTTTSTITTTTINQSNVIPLQKIMEFVNTTAPGILMNNFNMLYYKDRVCNASVYNATFQTLEGMKATGPNSFYNITVSVPRNINITVSQLGNSTYLVTYIGVTPAKIYTSPLLKLKVGLSPSPILLNVTFDGPFKYMNLTMVQQIYAFQSSINNFCGAYMPYIPHK